MPQKLLLIGWDAADWKLITPLLDAGQMPALEGLINTGCIGNIATLQPALSPMLWTSIATGKRPHKHGVFGFTEPDPMRGVVEPVTCRSRTTKAIWNILSQKGYKTNVVGWWPSHPAEPINGVCVSNFFQHPSGTIDQPWPVTPGSIHPKRLEVSLAELRIHPSELTEEQLLPFVPDAAQVDQAKDPHLALLAKILAECTTVHATATEIMETEPWDFMAVYYDAIDHFCHAFINYHPPRMASTSEGDFALYKDVITGCYRFHDMMLERLLHLAGPDTTVILLSDHGFHSGQLRPAGIPKVPAGPAVQHRQYGIFCIKGPGIKKDERIYGANLLDITPTILQLFDLPIGEDMDGRPLYQAMKTATEKETIPSWDAVDGPSGEPSTDAAGTPWEAKAVMEQLVALGYVEALDDDREKAVANAVREAKFNLAQSYIDTHLFNEAAPLLQDLADNFPDQTRFQLMLAKCRFELGDLDATQRIISGVLEANKDNPSALKLMAGIHIAKDEIDDALNCLETAEKAEPLMPKLHVQIGNLYLRLERWQDAESAFATALDIDGDSATAYQGMAQALIAMERYEAAAGMALNAVGLLHNLPLAHYHLGVCLAHLGEPERAVQAFETCLSMRPETPAARKWLAEIYEKALKDPEKAKEYGR